MAQIARDGAHVVVNLAAWAAGAGVAHLPEIVLGAELVDAILRHTLRYPQVIGFGIPLHAVFALEDGGVELIFRNPEPFRRSDQFPRVGNGVFLEVVAEGEVPQHLEKRVMTVGETHVFEIIVLAAGAHALL